MRTYTDSLWQRIYSWLCIMVVAGFAWVITGAFFARYIYLYAIPALIALYACYGLLGRQRLRVYLDDSTLQVKRGRRLKQAFTLASTTFTYYSKTTRDSTFIGSEHDYRLYAHEAGHEGEAPILVDLSEMSHDTFHQLLMDLDIYDPSQSIHVATTVKSH